MKPTVIGGGQPAKPTVIEPTKVGPTTVGPTKIQPTTIASEPVKITPTQIRELNEAEKEAEIREIEEDIEPLTSEEFKKQYKKLKEHYSAKSFPTTPSFPEPPPRPIVATVSAIPGRQVKCVSVSVLELQSRFPHEATEILDETRKILATVSPELFTTSKILMFGLDIQGQHTDLADKWLKILQDDQLRKNSRHIERLRSVLNDVIDDIGKRSWFRKQTIREKFEDDKVEIEQLKNLLEDGMYQLNMTHVSLAQLSDTAHWLVRMFKAYILACEYLGDILDEEKSQLIIDRGVSFAKSLGLVDSTIIKLDQNLKSIIGLITQVQDGVMVGIPSIMQAVATSTEETDTQKYLLKEQILDVINKLS